LLRPICGAPRRLSLRRSDRPSDNIVRNPFSDPSRRQEKPPFCGLGGQFADCADCAVASVAERATGVQFNARRAPCRAIHDPKTDWLSGFLPRGEVDSLGQVRPISGAGFVDVLPLPLEDPLGAATLHVLEDPKPTPPGRIAPMGSWLVKCCSLNMFTYLSM
jgi:hypothetical protein